MSDTSIVPSQSTTALATIAPFADQAAAGHVFQDYQRRKSPETLRRQRADLALFALYLQAAGVAAGELMCDPTAWSSVSWGSCRALSPGSSRRVMRSARSMS